MQTKREQCGYALCDDGVLRMLMKRKGTIEWRQFLEEVIDLQVSNFGDDDNFLRGQVKAPVYTKYISNIW